MNKVDNAKILDESNMTRFGVGVDLEVEMIPAILSSQHPPEAQITQVWKDQVQAIKYHAAPYLYSF